MDRKKGKKEVVNEAVENSGRFNKACIFWNRVYYSIYCIFIFIDRNVFVKILECLLGRSLYSQVFAKGKKKSIWESYEKSSFFYTRYTSGTMAIVVIFPILICAHILAIVYGADMKAMVSDHYGKILIILCVLCYLLDYFVLWRHNRYLKYFAIFEKESRKKKIAWCIGVAIYCITVLVAWFWTLTYL